MPLLIVGIFLSKSSALQVSIFMVMAFFASHAFTSHFLVPWAILPNVLDEYLLKYGNKMDALFYTIFALVAKILFAIYAGITQFVLRFELKDIFLFNFKYIYYV